MKRGDVVLAATGSGFGSKPRPSIVVQSDYAPTSLVILVGCTTHTGVNSLSRPLVEPSDSNGLMATSQIMTDIPVTTPRSKVSKIIGHLDARTMAEVDGALLFMLGLTEQQP